MGIGQAYLRGGGAMAKQRSVGNPFEHRGKAPTIGELNNPPETEKQLATITGGKLQIGGIRLTRTGLDIQKTATQKDFEQVGNILEPFADSLRWLIGDWLVLGERRWGKSVDELATRFKKTRGTMYNWTSVCKRVEFSRRREELDFTFHQEVAHLTPDEQTQVLQTAIDEKWSTRQLRAFIETGDPTPLSSKSTSQNGEIVPRKYRKLYETALKGQSGNPTAREQALSQLSQMERVVTLLKSLLNVK